MNKVVHFEIPADDVKRAEKFYQDTFGWKINPIPEMDYTIVHTAPTDEQNMIKEPSAINGGIMKRQGFFKNVNIMLDVESIDEMVEKIKSAGGEVVNEKMAVGDMGFTMYFKDTEGNIFGLWETKK